MSKYELATSIAIAGGKLYSWLIDSLPLGEGARRADEGGIGGQSLPSPRLTRPFHGGHGSPTLSPLRSTLRVCLAKRIFDQERA